MSPTSAPGPSSRPRSLASRAGLPNEIDLLNVVEAIEDVGNGQLRSVSRFMRLMLSHIILIAVDADANSVGHWTREAATFRGALAHSWQPNMRQRIDRSRIWRYAAEEASVKLSTNRGNAFDAGGYIRRFGTVRLFGIDDLCGDNFAFHDLVARLRSHLAPKAVA